MVGKVHLGKLLIIQPYLVNIDIKLMGKEMFLVLCSLNVCIPLSFNTGYAIVEFNLLPHS